MLEIIILVVVGWFIYKLFFSTSNPNYQVEVEDVEELNDELDEELNDELDDDEPIVNHVDKMKNIKMQKKNDPIMGKKKKRIGTRKNEVKKTIKRRKSSPEKNKGKQTRRSNNVVKKSLNNSTTTKSSKSNKENKIKCKECGSFLQGFEVYCPYCKQKV